MINKLAILIVILFLFLGCAIGFHARCLDTAIYQAQTFKNQGYEVRIVYGKTLNGIAHVQAQAKVDGEWEWLESATLIMVGRKHTFTVKNNLSLKEAKRRWSK